MDELGMKLVFDFGYAGQSSKISRTSAESGAFTSRAGPDSRDLKTSFAVRMRLELCVGSTTDTPARECMYMSCNPTYKSCMIDGFQRRHEIFRQKEVYFSSLFGYLNAAQSRLPGYRLTPLLSLK